jgi:hypothetical protein
VKPVCANGSVGLPHVRVGHRQALNTNPPYKGGFFYFREGGFDELFTPLSCW